MKGLLSRSRSGVNRLRLYNGTMGGELRQKFCYPRRRGVERLEIRERGTLIHGIHFQASQFGSADSGTFTINLVVTEPRVYQEWCRRSLPANPATALFPVQERIGRMDSKPRDRWWKITASTNIPEVETEVFEMLEKAEEGFFPHFLSLEAMLDRLRTTGALPGLYGGQRALDLKQARYDRDGCSNPIAVQFASWTNCVVSACVALAGRSCSPMPSTGPSCVIVAPFC
jgi:hypothetical protein